MAPSPLLERIKPLVHRILSSPSIIPSKVSAKTVRQTLIDDHGINKDELTKAKKEVKELIISTFRELYPSEPGGTTAPDADNMMLSSPVKGANGDVTMEPATPLKRKRDELIASQSVVPSSPAVPLVEETGQKKSRPKAKKDVDDEDNDSEIARKLQKSLSGERATRNAGKKRKTGTGSGPEGKKTRVKSKAYVNSDNDDSASGSEETGEPVKKKRKNKPVEKDGEPGPAKGGFHTPYILRYGLRSQGHLL
jgi:hypothetical protein